MASLPLANPDDLGAWLGQDIDPADPRAGAVLAAASALVRSYTGKTWGENDEVPDDVKGVVVQVAARVWVNPAGLEYHSVDDARRGWGQSGTLGLRLTDADKETLSGYVEGASSGLGSIGISAGGGNYDDTIYVPTGPPPSGYPFPWYSSDDLP